MGPESGVCLVGQSSAFGAHELVPFGSYPAKEGAYVGGRWELNGWSITGINRGVVAESGIELSFFRR